MLILHPFGDIERSVDEPSVTRTFLLSRKRRRSDPMILRHPTFPYSVMVRRPKSRVAAAVPIAREPQAETDAEIVVERPAAALNRRSGRKSFALATFAFAIGVLSHALYLQHAVYLHAQWHVHFAPLLRCILAR